MNGMLSGLLQGVAVVTGGGSGIGQAACISLVEHGVSKVAILDINAEAMKDTANLLAKVQQKDLLVLQIPTDMSKEESIVAAIDQVVKKLGRIDMLVNNAGITSAIAPSTDVSVDDFNKVISVNVIGLWTCQREVLRQMLSQDGRSIANGVATRGTIVNVSSTYGVVAMNPDLPVTPYVSSKHAVIGLTKADAVTYAKDGIRINAICPGFINTPAMVDAAAKSPHIQKEMGKVPMNRFGEPSEIAQGICFLLSPLSSYMTANSLVLDGGFTSV